MKKLCIFDFDGTIVDSITDVGICFNKALRICGFKEHSLEKYKEFVGGDLETVVSKLLEPKDRNKENIIKVKNIYYELYSNSNKTNTKPYENILELLQELQTKNIHIGINTNKKQKLVEELCEKFFPNIRFLKIIGYSENYPSKPNPQGVYDIINETKLSKEEILYIGDGATDIKTAQNAGIDMALVLWGQNSEKDLKNKSVRFFVEKVETLRNIIIGE